MTLRKYRNLYWEKAINLRRSDDALSLSLMTQKKAGAKIQISCHVPWIVERKNNVSWWHVQLRTKALGRCKINVWLFPNFILLHMFNGFHTTTCGINEVRELFGKGNGVESIEWITLVKFLDVTCWSTPWFERQLGLLSGQLLRLMADFYV